MLKLININKTFGAQVILDNAQLAVNSGEKVGLIGPNGTGKTTLFRIIEGIEGIDKGRVEVRTRAQVGVLRQEVAASERSVLAEVVEGDEELVHLRGERVRLEGLLASAEESGEQERLSMRLGEINHRLEGIGAYEAEARAGTILMGLGFSREEFDQPLNAFSGGWRMRVALARLLFSCPDLLLLDEPTNHLDIESVTWLEKFLIHFPGTLMVISHDRAFLNRVAGVIVELEGARLIRYLGNFDRYLEQREAYIEQLVKAAAQQEKRVAELERFIRRFRAKATKARQAQSRVKMLEKIKPVEKIATPAKAPKIRLPDPPASAYETLNVRDLSKRYGTNQVFSGVNLTLFRGEKIGLLGPNGAGKTSFLKIVSGKLEPTGGRAAPGDRVRVGYFAQHALDALETNQTVMESAAAVARPDVGKTELRTLLGGFLFSGDAVFKRVSVLSGGERSRLALARLFLSGANLLLLDEPTNHLDMEARTALEEALEAYAGTLVLVAHDRELLEAVCESYWVAEESTIRPLESSLDVYLEAVTARRQGEKEAPDAKSSVRRNDRETKRRAAEMRNRLHRETRDLRKKAEDLEERIHRLESEEEDLQMKLAEPGLYDEANKKKLMDLMAQHQEVTKNLQADMTAWEKIAIAIEDKEAEVRSAVE
jgi:ATP-binding cassette subfamily F protein 3